MQISYLEIVTRDVDAVCAAYAAAHGVQFGEPDSGLGNARTATLPDGGLVGVRAPLREDEEPVVRPYWLVDDIGAAVAAVEAAFSMLKADTQGQYTAVGRHKRGAESLLDFEDGYDDTP